MRRLSRLAFGGLLAGAASLFACTYQPLRLALDAADQETVGDPNPQEADSGDTKPPPTDPTPFGDGDTRSDPGPSDPYTGDPLGADASDGGDPSSAGDSNGTGDPNGFGDPTTTCTLTPSCNVDNLPGMLSASGSLVVGPSDELVPLCDGTVVVGDRATNQIRRVNLSAGTFELLTGVGDPPGPMAADDNADLVWVGTGDSLIVWRASDSHLSTIHNLDGLVLDIAAGPAGKVFALVDTSPWPSLRLVDSCDSSVVRFGPDADLDEMLAFDPTSANLFTHRLGGSGGSLRRFTFTSTNNTYQLQQSIAAGDNCRDLEVSPTGGHLVLACGSGNGTNPYYTLFDWKPADLTVLGEWNVGSFPRTATFSPDGTRMAAGKYTTNIMEVFRVSTHDSAGLYSPTINATACPSADIRRVRFSRGGTLVVGLVDCNLGAHSLLVWQRL